jgi:hypothetical protein
MAHLVVLGVDNPKDAEWVFDLAGDLTASSCWNRVVAGKPADVGINNNTIRQIGSQLEQGNAVVSCWLARPPSTPSHRSTRPLSRPA